MSGVGGVGGRQVSADQGIAGIDAVQDGAELSGLDVLQSDDAAEVIRTKAPGGSTGFRTGMLADALHDQLDVGAEVGGVEGTQTDAESIGEVTGRFQQQIAKMATSNSEIAAST